MSVRTSCGDLKQNEQRSALLRPAVVAGVDFEGGDIASSSQVFPAAQVRTFIRRDLCHVRGSVPSAGVGRRSSYRPTFGHALSPHSAESPPLIVRAKKVVVSKQARSPVSRNDGETRRSKRLTVKPPTSGSIEASISAFGERACASRAVPRPPRLFLLAALEFGLTRR
jgi:hypothetical protein